MGYPNEMGQVIRDKQAPLPLKARLAQLALHLAPRRARLAVHQREVTGIGAVRGHADQRRVPANMYSVVWGGHVCNLAKGPVD